MVLTPGELEKKILSENKATSEAIEKKIDNALLNTYELNRPTTIDYDCLFKGIRSYTINFVLDKYIQAGWNVKIVYDQREGDYIEFSKKKSEPAYDSIRG
jgi:hypothetical protein